MNIKTILVSLIMLATSICGYGQAYSGGNGTPGDPYVIADTADLNTLADAVNGGTSYAGIYFKVMAGETKKITLSGDFTPIGGGNPPKIFSGIFDGNNDTIDNLRIAGNTPNIGLFGYIGNGATIKNVVLTNVRIVCDTRNNVGGLVGSIGTGTAIDTIMNCKIFADTISTGGSVVGGLVGNTSIIGSGNGSFYLTNNVVRVNNLIGNGYIGGLIGQTASLGTINLSSANVNITSTSTNIGGLVGNSDGLTIKNSFSKGSIKSQHNSANSYIGGFIGYLSNTNIYNCFSNISITAQSSSTYVACFIGYKKNTLIIKNCYSASTLTRSSNSTTVTLTGFMNNYNGTLNASNCYFREDWRNGWSGNTPNTLSNITDISLDTMKTEGFITMLNSNTNDNDGFGGKGNPYIYDDTNLWAFPSNLNNGLPRLWWSAPASVVPPKVIIGSSTTASLYERVSPFEVPADFEGATPDTIILINGSKLTDNSDSTNYFLINLGGAYKSTAPNSPLEYLQAVRLTGNDKWNFLGSPIGDTTLIFFSIDAGFQYMSGVSFDGNPVSPIPNSFWLGAQAYSNPYSATPVEQNIGVFLWDYTSNGWNITGTKTSTIKKGEGVFAINMTNTTNYESNVDAAIFWHKTRTESEPSICNTDFDFDISSNTASFYNNELTGGNITGYWFALANPYSYPISAKAFIEQNETKLQGAGVVYTFNSSTNDWTGTDLAETPALMIAPMQGFMVAANNIEASEGYHPATLSFKADMDSVPVEAKSASITDITLNATANSFTKTAKIKIDPTASNTFDIKDAYVLFGQNYQAAEPYFDVDDTKIMINYIKQLPYAVALNIRSAQPNDVDLSFSCPASDISIKLLDLSNGSVIQMEDGNTYTTFISEGENSGRFVVLLGNQTNELQVIATEDLNLWSYNNRLTINGSDLEQISVYNTLGQLVFASKIGGSTYTTTIDSPSGSYIAKATSKSGSKSIKFIIK
ncbi:MAG: T9SS type A sorting domain-containing protein [Bacteroidales bacterium]|jgi:hypothetical protein|nr:T9SS type A sorting domain-containing protein [Bacteroidales bacterium]